LKPREKPISDNERKIKKNKTEDILKDKEKKLKDESKVKVKRKSSEGAGLNTTPSAKAKTKETKEKSTQGNESPTKKKVKKPYSSDDKLFPEARLDAVNFLFFFFKELKKIKEFKKKFKLKQFLVFNPQNEFNQKSISRFSGKLNFFSDNNSFFLFFKIQQNLFFFSIFFLEPNTCIKPKK